MSERVKRILLIIAGSLLVIIGSIGIIMPILPTTPFLLLAAACFIRSSGKCYNWLVRNRFLGSYIKNYLDGSGMPMRAKLITIVILWASIGFSMYRIHNPWITALLAAVAVGVSIHIFTIRTKR